MKEQSSKSYLFNLQQLIEQVMKLESVNGNKIINHKCTLFSYSMENCFTPVFLTEIELNLKTESKQGVISETNYNGKNLTEAVHFLTKEKQPFTCYEVAFPLEENEQKSISDFTVPLLKLVYYRDE